MEQLNQQIFFFLFGATVGILWNPSSHRICLQSNINKMPLSSMMLLLSARFQANSILLRQDLYVTSSIIKFIQISRKKKNPLLILRPKCHVLILTFTVVHFQHNFERVEKGSINRKFFLWMKGPYFCLGGTVRIMDFLGRRTEMDEGWRVGWRQMNCLWLYPDVHSGR